MTCPNCQRPLTEIDYYGEPLVGCINYNRWGKSGDKKLIMELLHAQLKALKDAQNIGLRGSERRVMPRCCQPQATTGGSTNLDQIAGSRVVATRRDAHYKARNRPHGTPVHSLRPCYHTLAR
jgi:hypothetical protein